MDNPTANSIDGYLSMVGCESDDSQDSNTSRSDDNEGLPGIIYTSDDSADVGQSDSTYADDIPTYIAQNVNPRMEEDELSGQYLLESERTSPQPSPQTGDLFISHPLAAINFTIDDVAGSNKDFSIGKNLYGDQSLLQVHNNGPECSMLNRSTSSSSTETESTRDPRFISQYEPLPQYPDDEGFSGGLHFEALKDDPIKTKVIHDQLNLLGSGKELTPKFQSLQNRRFLGDVHIDSKYANTFFVQWNWGRIRQSCVFINLSVLVGLLIVSVGMIIQMPQGSECNPVQEWWQGMVSYEIYIPSFQDSDGDGIGDLRGLINRLDYIESLGVRTVRLSPVFEGTSFLESSPPSSSNYTSVSPILGEPRDVQLLAALLNERDMFLVLDIPLVLKNVRFKGGKTFVTPKPAVDLVEDVPSIISFWMHLGVDGFIFNDLDMLSKEENLVEAVQLWRNALDARMRGIHRRVLMVPMTLLEKLESSGSPNLTYLLKLVDMIDVHLDVHPNSQKVAQDIDAAIRWDNHASYPWIHWSVGGRGFDRLFDQHYALKNDSKVTLPLLEREGSEMKNSSNAEYEQEYVLPWLSPIMLQLFLPGSVSIYYGDEIGLRQVVQEIPGWASPMQWVPDGSYSGFSKNEPWAPVSKESTFTNVITLEKSMQTLKKMIEAAQKEVPLYINGIFDYVGDYHPTKATNYKIRLASDNLLILDRFYPRRNKLSIVVNLGNETINRDLSLLYYGGSVLASTHGKEGYVRFRNIQLEPKEALMCLLDK